MEFKISAATLLARLREVAQDNIGPALGAFFFLVILNTATDLIVKGNELLLVSSIASFAAQYFVTRTAIDRLGSGAGAARIGGFFAVNLLTGLGIALGCLLLILPGLYLAARWIAAPAYLIGKNTTVSDAISQSWKKPDRALVRSWRCFWSFS